VLLLPVGDTALLVELPDTTAVLAVHAALSTDRERGAATGVEDLVPAERTELIRFDPRIVTAQAVRDWVLLIGAGPARTLGRASREGQAPEGQAREGTAADDDALARGPGGLEEVTIAVHYDGVDLADVGELAGLGAHGVIAAHTGRPWTVAFTGFAPGFGYLVGGHPRLRVPRLGTPRTRVPAGAVALAGDYSGVYPRPSPGGWRLIGRTDTEVWNLDRDPPALLRPGVVVRFVEAAPGRAAEVTAT
jgi:allophanate hydrolase subunit 1